MVSRAHLQIQALLPAFHCAWRIEKDFEVPVERVNIGDGGVADRVVWRRLSRLGVLAALIGYVVVKGSISLHGGCCALCVP